MNSQEKKYLFGPVASRRLGMSLGIDLVPYKTCSLNCVYCESGATTALTLERKEYVPTEAVIAQLDSLLATSPQIDYLTFSGAGEPTLHSGIGRIIEFVKQKYPDYKMCLLTNASLFGDPQVVKEICDVDLIVPSLDASNESEFNTINRPAHELDFCKFKDELVKFCRKYSSKIWLEIFIVPGINDSDESILRFAEIVKEIAPDKVQLNTLDRPGCVDWIKPSSRENTMRFIKVLEPLVPVEAVGPFKYKSAALQAPVTLEEIDRRIIDMISRRPCTAEDLKVSLGLEPDVLAGHLNVLLGAGKIQSERLERGEFFRPGA